MQSRMDRYNNETQIRSRTQKNKDLYEDVRNSSLTEFDVNSNVSVIDNQSDVIDVNRIKKMLDRRYSETAPKRRSIELPSYDDEPIIEEPLMDTKEYDINAVIAKAKQGKSVDYNKVRNQKILETQMSILEGLDLELKKVEETKTASRKAEEENLMNLINTITKLELENKNKYNKEDSAALDLLDLDDDDDEQYESDEIEIVNPEETNRKEMVEEITIKEPDEIVEETQIHDPSSESSENDEEYEEAITRDEHIEKTLEILGIDKNSYDDFKDISKRDTGTIVLKIIIFIIIIALVIGGVYIIDNILELGLF